MNLEHKKVLALNRAWQAVHVHPATTAIGMIFSGIATALDVQAPDVMVPTKWADWVKLPVRDEDESIMTTKGPIRMPTVMVLAKFARVPKKRPKYSSRAIWERDAATCQYTGQKLKPGQGNIDHVVPRARGGKTSWDNCVLSAIPVNAAKGKLLPEEAGLRLLRKPKAPAEVPITIKIKPEHPSWEPFLNN